MEPKAIAALKFLEGMQQGGIIGLDDQGIDKRIKFLIDSGIEEKAVLLGSLAQSNNIKLGDDAPDALVYELDGKAVSLHALLEDFGSRYVLINFGSYTWPPFRAEFQKVEQIASQFSDLITMITIYIVEAHSKDGWHLEANDEDQVCYMQPKTTEQRIAIASDFARDFKAKYKIVVDGINNATELAYEARPERLYIIKNKKIVYRSSRGPYGYIPEKVREWLESATK